MRSSSICIKWVSHYVKWITKFQHVFLRAVCWWECISQVQRYSIRFRAATQTGVMNFDASTHTQAKKLWKPKLLRAKPLPPAEYIFCDLRKTSGRTNQNRAWRCKITQGSHSPGQSNFPESVFPWLRLEALCFSLISLSRKSYQIVPWSVETLMTPPTFVPFNHDTFEMQNPNAFDSKENTCSTEPDNLTM